ncbi:MAG: hypothetical protein ACTSYF_12945, partial [Promethearchaeota archaeon]
SVSLLLNLFEQQVLNPSCLKILRVGRFTENLSEDLLIKFVRVLTENNLIHTAIEIYHDYYSEEKKKKSIDRDFTLSLLTHEDLLKPCDESSLMQCDDFYWEEVAKIFIKKFPKYSIKIAEFILDNVGKKGTIYDSLYSAAFGLLTSIAKDNNSEVWRILQQYLDEPRDLRSYHLEDWLRGEHNYSDKISGALYLFEPQLIWDWIDRDVENRAWYIAHIVPKSLFRSADNVCLTREVLVRYGDREDVRSSLFANFSSESWVGPRSIHSRRKKEWLLEYTKEEDNDNVIRWIDEYVDYLNESIEEAKIREERERY